MRVGVWQCWAKDSAHDGTDLVSWTSHPAFEIAKHLLGKVQTAVTSVRMMGTIEIASRDWERPLEHVTLDWTAPGAAATLWVVYSNVPITYALGEFVLQLPRCHPCHSDQCAWEEGA